LARRLHRFPGLFREIRNDEAKVRVLRGKRRHLVGTCFLFLQEVQIGVERRQYAVLLIELAKHGVNSDLSGKARRAAARTPRECSVPPASSGSRTAPGRRQGAACLDRRRQPPWRAPASALPPATSANQDRPCRSAR